MWEIIKSRVAKNMPVSSWSAYGAHGRQVILEFSQMSLLRYQGKCNVNIKKKQWKKGTEKETENLNQNMKIPAAKSAP